MKIKSLTKTTSVLLILMVSIWCWAEETVLEVKDPLEDISFDKAAKISMDFQNADLQNVLKVLSRQAGVNFIADGTVRNKSVTVYLDNVSIDDALVSILGANNLVYEKHSDNLFLIKSPISPVSTAVKLVTRVYRLDYIQVYNMATSGGVSIQTASAEGDTSTASSSETNGADGEQNIIAIIRNLMSSQGKIVADRTTNSLIITDAPDRFEAIEQVIKELDVEPIQVMIQAEIIETTTGAIKRIGMEYGTESSTFSLTYGANANAAGSLNPVASTPYPLTQSFIKNTFGKNLINDGTFTYGTLSGSSTTLILKLFANDTDTKYLSRPKIMTLNNRPAVIQITENTAVGTTTTAISQSGDYLYSAERVQTGILLKVTPSVNKNRDIFMYLQPSVTRATTSTFNPTYQDPKTSSAATTVMVREGETVVMGGLIDTENVKTVRKVPILGDIPLLGEPFKSRYKKVEDTELIIFITPRIIEREKTSAEVIPEYMTDRNYTMQKILNKYEKKENTDIMQEALDKYESKRRK